MLVVQARDMPHYLAISQTLFTQDANVRNVKAFFATKRAKFTTALPLLSWAQATGNIRSDDSCLTAKMLSAHRP
jgi:hypothetical protein